VNNKLPHRIAGSTCASAVPDTHILRFFFNRSRLIDGSCFKYRG
jgi:hypothetical protein